MRFKVQFDQVEELKVLGLKRVVKNSGGEPTTTKRLGSYMRRELF